MVCQVLSGARFVAAPFLVAIAFVAPAVAQQYIPLPAGYRATDVTPDGKIVVGTNGLDSFIWRWKQDPAPTVITGGAVVGASDDGTVLAGDIFVPFPTPWDPNAKVQVAAIWTQATGWQSLGWLTNALECPSKSNAYAISGDGSTVVGLSWFACDGRGFRWTAAAGMQELQGQGFGHNRCTTISRDGSAAAGFAQGNFNRTPAYWASNLSGSVLDLNFEGEVYGFNNNGSLSVGSNYFGGLSLEYGAFIRDQQTGVMTDLGNLNPGWSGNATDMSEDGNVIVGYDSQMLAIEAWVWTSSDGIISLNNRLAALGVTGVPPLGSCSAVSDSGDVIVGGGGFSPGFIVEFPSLVSFGSATLGCAGYPVLEGNQTPRINTPTFALTSTKAPQNALGLVMITDAPDMAGSDPFSLGVNLHVDFFSSTETLSLDAYSDLFGVGTAPAAIPNNPFLIGKTYFAQVLWSWPFSNCYLSNYNLSTTQGLAITILP